MWLLYRTVKRQTFSTLSTTCINMSFNFFKILFYSVYLELDHFLAVLQQFLNSPKTNHLLKCVHIPEFTIADMSGYTLNYTAGL